MQLEDEILKSSGKAVEGCDNFSPSTYKFRTQIGTRDQSFIGSTNSSSTTLDLDSKDHYPMISTTEYSQTQDDYEMAVQLSGKHSELLKTLYKGPSSSSDRNTKSLASPLEAMQLQDTDEGIESPIIPEVDLNENKSRDSDEKDSQIQHDHWMAMLLSGELSIF